MTNNTEVWKDTVTSSPDDLAKNLRILVLNLAALTPEAMQVDMADNFTCLRRLSSGLKDAQRDLDTIFNDIRKKRYKLEEKLIKTKSTDPDGEAQEYTINR